jgi:hypothetical protein
MLARWPLEFIDAFHTSSALRRPAAGLPRLEDPGGSLSAADLEVLRREIDRQFERLVGGGEDRQRLALNGSASPDLPQHFWVTVTERDKRCPTLLLEPGEPPAETDGAAAPTGEALPEPSPGPEGRWQSRFLAEMAERMADTSVGAAARAPLDFVLGDLQALLRKDPYQFTLLLFAGYLHVGDALSRKHGESGDNRYARAALALSQLAGAAPPEGALDPLLPKPAGSPAAPADGQEEERTGWLRRFFALD